MSKPPKIGRIRILTGQQSDGVAYELAPASREELRKAVPSVPSAPRVFVGHDTKADYELQRTDLSVQVAIMLTGLPKSKLQKVGVDFIDPRNNEVLVSLGGEA